MTDDRQGPMLPEDLPPIPEGKAHVTMTAAFLDVLSALARLEATCAAIARALDATAERPR